MVESQPSKLLVAGSIPVSRSRVEASSGCKGCMAFEQATIRVVREREFAELKDAIEKAVGTRERAGKFLKVLSGGRVQVRQLEAVLAASALDDAVGNKPGTARSLYDLLPVSDQAQVREFYLSKIEEVDPVLRAKFHKLYQYS